MVNELTGNATKRIELKRNNHKNIAFTPLHTQCKLCHYAGFSNKCDFLHESRCHYIDAKKDLRRNNGHGIRGTQKDLEADSV